MEGLITHVSVQFTNKDKIECIHRVIKMLNA